MVGTHVLVLLAAIASGSAGQADTGRPAAPGGKRIEDGVLDSITLHADSIPRDVAVVIRPFSAAGADLGTGGSEGKEERQKEARTIQTDGPRLLAESFAAELRKLGPFREVSVAAQADAVTRELVLEGEFTMLNPGSRAKRYFGGFGAGKSTVQVKGSVRDADGRVLAEFIHERNGAMGAFGGDSLGKLRSDCKSIGMDLAKFLSTWALGKKLK